MKEHNLGHRHSMHKTKTAVANINKDGSQGENCEENLRFRTMSATVEIKQSKGERDNNGKHPKPLILNKYRNFEI